MMLVLFLMLEIEVERSQKFEYPKIIERCHKFCYRSSYTTKYSYYYVWVNVLCWAKSWTMVIFFSLSNFYLEITTSFSSYIIFHICNTSQTHPNKLWVPSRHSFSTQSDTGNLTPSTFPHLESAFSLNLQNHHPEVSRCCRPRHKSLCLFYVFYFISWIPCFLYHCYCTHLGVTHPLLLKNST